MKKDVFIFHWKTSEIFSPVRMYIRQSYVGVLADVANSFALSWSDCAETFCRNHSVDISHKEVKSNSILRFLNSVWVRVRIRLDQLWLIRKMWSFELLMCFFKNVFVQHFIYWSVYLHSCLFICLLTILSVRPFWITEKKDIWKEWFPLYFQTVENFRRNKHKGILLEENWLEISND